MLVHTQAKLDAATKEHEATLKWQKDLDEALVVLEAEQAILCASCKSHETPEPAGGEDGGEVDEERWEEIFGMSDEADQLSSDAMDQCDKFKKLRDDVRSFRGKGGPGMVPGPSRARAATALRVPHRRLRVRSAPLIDTSRSRAARLPRRGGTVGRRFAKCAGPPPELDQIFMVPLCLLPVERAL